MAEERVRGDLLDRGDDGLLRCFWGGAPEEYRRYHDTEWGRPVHEDRRLFEKICLEGFQSGLSWLTILRKRPAFRAAFADFDVEAVADFDERDVEQLLQDAGIVRHRGKIVSTINNAKRCAELHAAGETLNDLVWSYEPPKRSRPKSVTRKWLMNHPTSPESTALSKDLKRRGWTFVGPTTIYAFMQSVGIVDDHQAACHVRAASDR
ncbi:MAG TPA: DNA-3-methyladenine glycosylase I [Actinomycetes bacterium]|nr:DNA-3-methyladenine glycosylase I [Actinomycetes bacterium]